MAPEVAQAMGTKVAMHAAEAQAVWGFKHGMATHSGENWVAAAGHSTNADVVGPLGTCCVVHLCETWGNEVHGFTAWWRPFGGVLGALTQLRQLPYRLTHSQLTRMGYVLLG